MKPEAELRVKLSLQSADDDACIHVRVDRKLLLPLMLLLYRDFLGFVDAVVELPP